MDSKMNWSILYVFAVQIAIACLGAFASLLFDEKNADAAYYLDIKQDYQQYPILKQLPFLIFFIRAGTWILLLT